MNKTKRLAGIIGFVLCTALFGCATYGQPSVSVGVVVPLPSVEIRADSDFYEPLTPYGRWEVVGSYGRCWIPGRVAADWRPYSEGYWQRTDAGWYWASDEPWAWATYHYGRWDLSPQFGWYWVPQTQWAPAWVSWHTGGGYVGWAPLYPSGVTVISPRAYVFVEERHFMDPVRRSTVVAYNTTLIKKTVIREAPATVVIEKASGRKIQPVPVQELRHKSEAAVVTKQRTPTATSERKVQPAVRTEAQPAEKKAVVARESAPVQKPAAARHESAAPAPERSNVQSEARKSVPAAAESKAAARSGARPEIAPAAKSEARPKDNPPAAIKEPTGQNAKQQPGRQEYMAQPAARKAQQPARETPVASEKNGPNPGDKNHEGKPNQ